MSSVPQYVVKAVRGYIVPHFLQEEPLDAAEIALAVWEALLAEGDIREGWYSGGVPQRCLVVPLGVEAKP